MRKYTWFEDSGDVRFSGSISYYRCDDVENILKEKNDEIEKIKRLNKELSNKLTQNVQQVVDNNAQYWKELCEKRTQMYLEEQARANALGEQLQKEIHKPFPYIEKLEVMKIALFKRMAETAYYHYRFLELWLQHCCWSEETISIYKPKFERKHRQWKLFKEKAKELEKELNEE